MPSKARSDREASARVVITSLTTHKAEIEEGLAAFLRPYAKRGEALPEVGPLLEFLARALTTTLRNYAAADDAHEAEQADDVAPREARDTSAAALRETVMDLRRALEPGGRAVLTTFGLAAPVSEKPTEILTTGRYVLTRLEDDALPWPKPRRGVSVDRKLFIEDLTAQVSALDTALAKVATETKELESTKLMRDTVESVHNAMFSLSAGLGWEVFKAAGKVELADRIRPSARRPGQTDVPPEAPAPTPPA